MMRGLRDVVAEAVFRVRMTMRNGVIVWILLFAPVLAMAWAQVFNAGSAVPVPGCHVGFLRQMAAQGQYHGACWTRFYLYGTAAMIAVSAMLVGTVHLATRVTHAREQGELLRVRSSPMSMRTYMAGHLLASLLLVVLMSAVLLAVGARWFDVPVDLVRAVSALPALALGFLAMAAIGLLLSVIAKSSAVASSITYAFLLVSVTASSIFHSPHLMPPDLHRWAGAVPLKQLVVALHAALEPVVQGPRLPLWPLAVLALYASACVPLVLLYPTTPDDR